MAESSHNFQSISVLMGESKVSFNLGLAIFLSMKLKVKKLILTAVPRTKHN